jgi:hypothetical protein
MLGGTRNMFLTVWVGPKFTVVWDANFISYAAYAFFNVIRGGRFIPSDPVINYNQWQLSAVNLERLISQ